MIRVAVNGFGRIGRCFFKLALEKKELALVAVNDLTDPANLAYLLRYDTVYGRYDKPVKVQGDSLLVGGSLGGAWDKQKIKVLSEKDPAALPWKKLGVDVVVESTGRFANLEDASKHIQAGAKKVVISAPAEDVTQLLIGVNDKGFEEPDLPVVTCNGSCTTNAVAPVVAVAMENPGVVKGMLNTVHAYTATQNLVDGPATKDYRRGRAAAANIVPSTTGAAEAVIASLPELKGRFDGIAMRVPVVCGSIADFTFLSKRKTSVSEINEIFKEAAKTKRWEGILKVTEEPLTSADIIADPYASIVDLTLTRVIDDDFVKVLAWYDNEWAYAVTLVEHVLRVGS
ncbi:type I glyceraldehyde-3-phosphate dehydrogenase [candidate division WWE3 bacterium CG10_big_fil_rev_8_21_14_0_10_48_23]|nr:MAG: type I glyceraldehyde-3-phosphate dehydrogenase [candidate division WWE3 bacterium CG_4_10_14_0_2_um_filter_47_8]PJE51877.1 MAG: type I glyceraldehyde-3-phosphate dehydrogenase [candidate division WWE3 bacterium CG10_big_fil_rev_8_21_14_0_10_48_23]